MMRQTPRSFVGPAVFEVDGQTCRHVEEAVLRELGRLPGISRCEVDRRAGIVLVTARTPVERAGVVEVLGRLGVRLRA